MRWVQNANKPARRCLGHFWVLGNSHDFVCDLTGLYRGRAVFLSVTFTGGLVGCWCWVELFRPKRETPEPSGWNQVSEQTLVQTPTQDHCHQICTHSKFHLPKVVSKMKSALCHGPVKLKTHHCKAQRNNDCGFRRTLAPLVSFSFYCALKVTPYNHCFFTFSTAFNKLIKIFSILLHGRLCVRWDATSVPDMFMVGQARPWCLASWKYYIHL